MSRITMFAIWFDFVTLVVVASLEKQTRCYEVWGEEAQILNMAELVDKHPKNGPIYPIRNTVRTELSTQVDKDVEHDAVLKIAELANNYYLYTTDSVAVVLPEEDALTVLIEGGEQQDCEIVIAPAVDSSEVQVSTKEEIDLLLDEINITKDGLTQLLATHGRGKYISGKVSSLHKNITHRTWNKNGRQHDLVRIVFQNT